MTPNPILDLIALGVYDVCERPHFQRLRVTQVPATQATLQKWCQDAGYLLIAYGCNADDGLYVDVRSIKKETTPDG